MAVLVKQDETRHWSTAYRGPIAIHAAKTIDVAGAPWDLCNSAFGPDWPTILPRGAFLGIGNLTRCTSTNRLDRPLTSANQAAGNFGPDRFAWKVEDFRRFREPIPGPGRQGLFSWTPAADVEALLLPTADHAEACRQIGWP
jgi:hypothetical protein